MAVAPPGGAGGSRWTWRPVVRDALLARAFHSCTELRGRLYLVGGLLAGGAREPSGDTVVWDPAGGQAVRVGARGGPRRSHHDAAPLGGRWLCAVGGWDGSRRLASVAALDTERGEWEAWTESPGSCPPAGLSSHTCTRLSDRELRVAGREGGTRTQRRYGSVYTLRLDPRARTYWRGPGEKAVQNFCFPEKPTSGLIFCSPPAIRKKAATQPPAQGTVRPCSQLRGPAQVTSCCCLVAASQRNQK